MFNDIANAGVSVLNNHYSSLTAGEEWSGRYEECSRYASVVMAVKTDQAGTLYIDFSPDSVNTDSTLSFSVSANVNEVHRITVIRRYFRVRFLNTGSNQTFFRLQTLVGQNQSLTSSINNTVQSDADASIVRAMDFNLLVSEGLFQGRNVTIKDGLNLDIDQGAITQDFWDAGGVYSGFPVGTIENGMAVSTNAGDTGTLYFSYLASPTSTDYTFTSVQLNGITPVSTGVNIWRCNFAYYDSGDNTTFNLGTIKIYHQTTTANIFVTITIGYSQSYCAAYTVPYGASVYIDRFNGNVRGSATATVEGFVWYRPYNESPRLRFPFELQFQSLYFDDVDYLIKIPALVDFIPRAVFCSANNTVAKYSFRLMKVTG